MLIRDGSLFKQSRYLKKWRQRWFVLTTTHMLTYQEAFSYQDPTEVIPIMDCVAAMKSEEREEKFEFKLETRSISYRLRADNLYDLERWINDIQEAIFIETKKNKSTPGTVSVIPTVLPAVHADGEEEEKFLCEQKPTEEVIYVEVNFPFTSMKDSLKCPLWIKNLLFEKYSLENIL